ncbi:hypothetical protein [Streptosporangium amethystogenes]|uniref:hypothetical protein n=1 Tax=Streptosporangium amethystogenes TaxID=2002 RepID=UPI001B803836|nr:hypothetical protein [Streptosporangium amethystogenes]
MTAAVQWPTPSSDTELTSVDAAWDMVTALGFDVLRQGEAIFDELRDQWEQRIEFLSGCDPDA